jgi:hypothetical protein
MHAAVDWQQWTEDERRAALSHVLLPRDRDEVLNGADLDDVGPNKPRQIALRSTKAANKSTTETLQCTSTTKNSPQEQVLNRSDSAGSSGGRLSLGRLVSLHGDVVQVSCKGITSKARVLFLSLQSPD